MRVRMRRVPLRRSRWQAICPSASVGGAPFRAKAAHRTSVGTYSSIEWTDATWNPVRGCTKVSPGCKHCYAATFAERWRGIPGHPYEQGFDVRLVPEKLVEPLRWIQPRAVFVNSMSDLFQEAVPVAFIKCVASIMRLGNWHTYQVLTKRAERMRDVVNEHCREISAQKHIWLGVSVENRRHGIPRIDCLRDTRAAVRFLSIEPLLEDLGELNLTGIDWVIVGGESGAGARPMDRDWVQSIRRQCRSQDVHFFFKQWGGKNKSATGRSLDGRTYDDLPPIHRAAVPSSHERVTRIAAMTSHILSHKEWIDGSPS